MPFSKVFSTVGSSFSLAKAPQGNLEISNKESRLPAYKEGRLPALRTMVNSVCNNGFDQPAGLASLKSGFLCASTHTFGSGYSFWQGGGILRLDNEDCTLLKQTIDLLEDVRPREIFAGNGGAPVECRLLYASTHTFGRVADMGALLS